MIFFFFKQKTAYEMRISDWSSDVCSSDLIEPACDDYGCADPDAFGRQRPEEQPAIGNAPDQARIIHRHHRRDGRESHRGPDRELPEPADLPYSAEHRPCLGLVRLEVSLISNPSRLHRPRVQPDHLLPVAFCPPVLAQPFLVFLSSPPPLTPPP